MRLPPQGGALHLVLARPSKKNALTLPMCGAMADALHQAQDDAAVTALLLHGEGGHFTAGHDLTAFSEWPQALGVPVPAYMHTLARNRKPLKTRLRPPASPALIFAELTVHIEMHE